MTVALVQNIDLHDSDPALCETVNFSLCFECVRLITIPGL